MNCEVIRRTHFLVSAMHWFDWINLARALLHNLHLIHTENVVMGDLQLSCVWVQRVNAAKPVPYIVDFRHACYGNSTTKDLLSRLPRGAAAAATKEHADTSAHGYEDAIIPKHVRTHRVVLVML